MNGRSWLKAAGVEGLDLGKGVRFDTGQLALRAAISGLGIAIGRLPLIDDDLGGRAPGRAVQARI